VGAGNPYSSADRGAVERGGATSLMSECILPLAS